MSVMCYSLDVFNVTFIKYFIFSGFTHYIYCSLLFSTMILCILKFCYMLFILLLLLLLFIAIIYTIYIYSLAYWLIDLLIDWYINVFLLLWCVDLFGQKRGLFGRFFNPWMLRNEGVSHLYNISIRTSLECLIINWIVNSCIGS